jgi:HD-GYP domain-containing protein (c-di-GMP phosphodiesterase class II)
MTTSTTEARDSSGAGAWEARLARVGDLLGRDARLQVDGCTRPHPLLIMVTRGALTVLVAPGLVWDRGRDLFKPFAARFADGAAMLVLLGQPRDEDLAQAMNKGLASIVSVEPTADELYVAIFRAFELLEAKYHAETRGKSLNRYRYELAELVDIARVMTTERDVQKLLSVILEKSRFITGADAGSIYIIDADDKNPQLRFKLTQNDSVSFDSREFVIPLSNRSIAGSAAVTKKPINIADVYDLPAGSPYAFDKSFDEKIGYQTKSMLTYPLISQRDEVIGVIQLINKKKEPQKRLLSPDDFTEQVIPFDARSEELLGMLATQAGVSLENTLLYREIRELFEGFVKASVEAIESRDPTTSGHSRRVADLTIQLAMVVDNEKTGPYKDAFFSKDDLRELEYASLLHDFGKIGVRERVLVKAKKLFDERLDMIRARFDFVERTMEADVLTRKLRALSSGSAASALEALDRELAERRAGLEDAYRSILNANEPTVLAAGDFEKIEQLAKETYMDMRGEKRRLLEDEEVVSLSVKRGSLTPQEFDEIRSHVTHTFNFLSQIPWGKMFRRVPLIAGAHHERLNGTGYPKGLRAEEIPIQSKMMSIADIYDALTASDRPYKKAVPLEKALDILEFGVKDGHLDGELVRVFREARVWDLCEPVPASVVFR